MNEDELVFKRGASPPLQPIKYSFQLPAQYLSQNWRKSSSSSSESSESRPRKPNKRKKSKKKSKKSMRYEGKLHLVPAADGNLSASASPSPPPMEPEPVVVKDNKLCEDYCITGYCARTECFLMHKEFPCKFFYLGLDCADGDDCKQAHKSEFLTNEMKHGLLNHIFKSRPEVLGEEFFNFKKTKTIPEIITLLEKRLSEFPQPVKSNVVHIKPQARVKVDKHVKRSVSFFVLFLYFLRVFENSNLLLF